MQPKGKQGTKGQKQILQENASTLAFYRNMMLCAGALYFTVGYLLLTEFPTLDLVFVVIASVVGIGCYQFMASMSTPKYGPNGSLLDEGCDLNIEGGIAEHVKDIIILTSTCLVLATVSTYFWLLWLLIPARAFQMLWTNILSPYIFQEASEEPEVSDKKQRKVERKMMRHR